MSDISSQLIKDSYNYVLQSDVSTGNIYRIGGGIPVNPIFLSGLTINGELNATTISSGPVIIKSNNNDQLLLTTTNYNSGSDGNILYFYTQTGITYSNISARTNGGSSNADLVLQESIGSNVGIGKVPSSIYKLDVNGAIGATSISATTITTPFSGGSVLFAGTSGQISQDNSQLFWDNTNNRLGIGLATPTTTFQVLGTSTTQNIAAQTNATYDIGLLATRFRDGWFSRNLNCGTIWSNNLAIATTNLTLYNAAVSVIGTLFGSGNLLLSTGTQTDAGFRLDVNGTARVSDISYLTLGARIGTTTTAAGIFPSGTSGRESLNLRSSLLPTDTGNDVVITNGQGDVGNTSSIRSLLTVARSFAPTSGTGIYNLIQVNPTINQTGGANGITRGLYINPTLTAAADFRAIETTAGNVLFGASGTGFFWDNTNNRLGIGTASPLATIHSVGSVTAATAIARGNYLQPTLVATANSDVLVGLDIQPTFTTGAFTGVSRFPLRIRNSANDGSVFSVTSDGVVRWGNRIESGNSTGQLSWDTDLVFINAALNLGFRTGGSDRMRIFNTGNVAIATTTDAGFKLDVNGTARVSGAFRADNTLLVNGTSINASAIAQFDSGTRGFLPPRMTNAQRLLISTPAVGLMVYCTDSTEGLYINKSTGWTYIG